MTATTTDVTTLADCPACKKPITARLTYEVKIDPPVVEQGVPSGPDRLVAATLTAVGVHIQHDCTPRATRGYAGGTFNDEARAALDHLAARYPGFRAAITGGE